MRLSLQTKTTLWFLGIFTIAFAAVLCGAWFLHRETTRHQLDERLEDLARGVGEVIHGEDRPPWMDRFHSLQPTERTFVVLAVRDATGEVMASQHLVETDALPPLPQAGSEDVVIRPLPPEQARRLLGRPVTSRIVTYRSTLSDGSVRYIDLTTTSDITQESQTFLFDVVVGGAVGALLASGLAAWLIAGRAVRPMKQLADAAERVDPERMGGGIDVKGDELEVDQVRTAMNQALTRLEDRLRAQERFISNVAHDLKTPIAVMLTESQVLQSGHATREDFETYRDSVIVEMRRLGGLIESFLTLARADQGEALARVVDVPIPDLTLEAIAECDREAEQRGVRLITTLNIGGDDDEERHLRGDPDLLRTMLVNLIRNAIRHSPPNAAVEVRAVVNGFAAISVRDHGPGVPDELRDAVFDRFVKSPQQSNGTGLGLAIAKSVAEMHRGSIALRNCVDGGCEFTVNLPLKEG